MTIRIVGMKVQKQKLTLSCYFETRLPFLFLGVGVSEEIRHICSADHAEILHFDIVLDGVLNAEI